MNIRTEGECAAAIDRAHSGSVSLTRPHPEPDRGG